MDQHAIHYLFAACGGRLVDIHDFDPALDGTPACPGCGAELAAVQGAQRAWHFRHREDGGCSVEHYNASCAALEQHNASSGVFGQRLHEAVQGHRGWRPAAATQHPAPLATAGPRWGHPLIIGVGLLAAVSFVFLVGEARRR